MFILFLFTYSQPLGHECAWQITKSIGSAFCVLHDRKIVHDELSPANIIIRSDETPVLIDFGLGVHIADQATVTTEGFSGSAAATNRKRVVHANMKDRKIAILTACLTLSLPDSGFKKPKRDCT